MDHGPVAEIDDWAKKYRWVRSWPNDRGLDGKPLEDYVGFDGDQYIGRIFQDAQTTEKRDQWRWSGSYPRGCRDIILPHSGWLPTAKAACRQVEAYWDAAKHRG
ncbi:hypothetical protein [Agrobacterium sp. MS2]|uniref:hypothetical protein n=1 Tax=Agrobacterium sp. MS2 TaxID=1345498 RepID=UPI000DBF6225|nr:hypothetical protein [Agrobacterium sp. MS2]RAL98711.1 hypothetical protein DOU54_06540 [Agrobacterium sp. MS2]